MHISTPKRKWSSSFLATLPLPLFPIPLDRQQSGSRAACLSGVRAPTELDVIPCGFFHLRVHEWSRELGKEGFVRAVVGSNKPSLLSIGDSSDYNGCTLST